MSLRKIIRENIASVNSGFNVVFTVDSNTYYNAGTNTHNTLAGYGIAGGIPASYLNLRAQPGNTYVWWADVSLLAHELGHCFGLYHTNENHLSECLDDYKIETSEWNLSAFCSSSDALHSNNILAYNYGCRHYLSPRQLGLLHKTLKVNFQDRVIITPTNHFIDVNPDLNYTLSANEIWTTPRYMKGDVIIPANIKLTIQCKVDMARRGRIIVEKGGQLVIDGGHVTNSFGKLWGGVHVAGDATGGQVVNNITGFCMDQGVLWIKNGGTLSQANTAARNYKTDANDNIVWSSTGGIIIGNNANFIDNGRDVEFITFPNLLSRSSFDACNFRTAGLVNEGQIPYAHVSLWDVIGVNFRGCNFEYASANYTGNEGYGIHSIDATYNVNKLCSNSLNPSCATPTTFKNLNLGVLVNNSNPLRLVSITNSSFLNMVNDGVYFHNMNGFVFENNIVKTTGLQTTSNGMFLNTCKYYTVKNNTFLESLNNHYNTGMYVYNSQDGAHRIYRNKFGGFVAALIPEDNNSGNTNTTDGLLMNCNDFSTPYNLYDIALLGNGTGNNSPTVMRTQGAITSQNSGNLVRNIYGAPCGYSGKWFAAGAGVSNLIIQHGSNSDAFALPLPQPSCSNPIVNVVNSGIPLDYPNHCLTTLSSGGGNGSNPTAILANINSYFQTLQAQGASVNKFELQATAAAKQSYYLTDNSAPSKDTVINLVKNNRGSMKDADIQLVFAYMNKNDYVNATTKANALVNRADWKALLLKLIAIYKEPNKIYSINTNIAAGYKTFLQGYANTPYKDGQGIAQSLLKFVSKINYTEPRLRPARPNGARMMSADEQTISEVESLNNGIQVYPNPTFNGITLVYNTKQVGQALVEVKDLLGKVIYSNFISNESSTYIPLENYNNGVYLITVTKNEEVFYKTKIIKQE